MTAGSDGNRAEAQSPPAAAGRAARAGRRRAPPPRAVLAAALAGLLAAAAAHARDAPSLAWVVPPGRILPGQLFPLSIAYRCARPAEIETPPDPPQAIAGLEVRWEVAPSPELQRLMRLCPTSPALVTAQARAAAAGRVRLPRVAGVVESSERRRTAFARTQRIDLATPDAWVEVGAVPAGWPEDQPWLVADAAELELLAPPTDAVAAGTLLELEARLTLLNADPGRIPSLRADLSGLEEVKRHRSLDSRDTPQGTAWIQRLRVEALVAGGGAAFQVQPLHWWDAGQGRVRTEAAELEFTAPPAPAQPIAQPTPQGLADAAPVALPQDVWKRWPFRLLSAAAAVLLALWVRAEWRLRKARGKPPPPPPGDPEEASNEVLLACNIDDPKAARTALLRWAALRYGLHRPTLEQLMAEVENPDFRLAVRSLDKACYGPTADRAWKGLELRSSFSRIG